MRINGPAPAPLLCFVKGVLRRDGPSMSADGCSSLGLPVLLGVCGLSIFWMWFDNVYGDDGWSAVGGLLVALATIPLTLWTWESWSKVKASSRLEGAAPQIGSTPELPMERCRAAAC
jgi:hypothetical protein